MLVRVQVEAAAGCGFTGCITLKTSTGLTVAELKSEVLKSIARKTGRTNLDESHFQLSLDGQEVTSVQACYGSKLAQLVRKPGKTQGTPESSPYKGPRRRPTLEATELQEKLGNLLQPECSAAEEEEEKWLDFGKEKKETQKRINKLEQRLENVHQIAVTASELVNLEHDRLGQIKMSSEAINRTVFRKISNWRSLLLLLLSGMYLHACVVHFVFPEFVKFVESLFAGASSLVFVALAVISATIFVTTVRAESKGVGQIAASTINTQPLVKAAQAAVRQSNRAEEQARALTLVPALRDMLPPTNLQDKALVRFIIAREFNLEATAALVTEYIQWYSATSPNTITPQEVSQSFHSGKAFCFGMDKQRRPCVYVIAKLHDRKLAVTETDRFQARVLAPVCELIERGEFYADEFVSIFDFADFGLANFDVGALTKVISNLDKHYCEQLGKLYLINASSMFFALWKLVVPFIPERTKAKINIFKAGQDFKSELLRDFEPSQLLPQHGGTASFVYDPVTYAGPVIPR